MKNANINHVIAMIKHSTPVVLTFFFLTTSAYADAQYWQNRCGQLLLYGHDCSHPCRDRCQVLATEMANAGIEVYQWIGWYGKPISNQPNHTWITYYEGDKEIFLDPAQFDTDRSHYTVYWVKQIHGAKGGAQCQNSKN
jgi:hypothetical protein